MACEDTGSIFQKALSKAGDFGAGLRDQILGTVSPILSTKPTAKYLSGARATIKINNQIVGFAFGISWKITTLADEIFTIDDYMPYEIAPNKIMVEGSLSMFHVPGRGPTAEFIQSNFLSFMHQKYIQIEVRDSATDNLIFLTKKALVIGRSQDVKSESLATMQLSFKAIGWQDELTPELPDGVENTAPQEDGSSRLSN